MAYRITFSARNTATPVDGGVRVNGLVTTPTDDCFTLAVTFPASVLATAGTNAGDIGQIVAEGAQFIDFETSDALVSGGDVVATALTSIGDLRYYLATDADREALSSMFVRGAVSFTEEQATMAAKILGARDDFQPTVRQAREIIATFA